ncbi:MAG: PIN domain-containing protein [Steroidobacteraceae bacterium]
MPLYMLHTAAATALIQGKSPELDRRIASAAPHELCISAVTRGELLCGLSRQTLQKKGRETKAEPSSRKETVGETVGDGSVGSGTESDLDDVIMVQPMAPSIDQTTIAAVRKTTHAALAALTPREAKALRTRFGIDMDTDHTLERVGRQFDVTREHIRLREQADPLSRVLDQFLTRVPCLPWDAEAATHFARIAVDLHLSGSPMGGMDTMIAGHAIAVGAVLVTNNERRFARVAGLKTENWTRN